MQVAVLPSLAASDIDEGNKRRLLKSFGAVLEQLHLTEDKRFDDLCAAIKQQSGLPLFVLVAPQGGACHPTALLHKLALADRHRAADLQGAVHSEMN